MSIGRDEYEYFSTVRANAVPRLRELLGGDGDDGLLERIKELLAPEEINASRAWKAWLKSHGVPYLFAVR